MLSSHPINHYYHRPANNNNNNNNSSSSCGGGASTANNSTDHNNTTTNFAHLQNSNCQDKHDNPPSRRGQLKRATNSNNNNNNSINNNRDTDHNKQQLIAVAAAAAAAAHTRFFEKHNNTIDSKLNHNIIIPNNHHLAYQRPPNKRSSLDPISLARFLAANQHESANIISSLLAAATSSNQSNQSNQRNQRNNNNNINSSRTLGKQPSALKGLINATSNPYPKSPLPAKNRHQSKQQLLRWKSATNMAPNADKINIQQHGQPPPPPPQTMRIAPGLGLEPSTSCQIQQQQQHQQHQQQQQHLHQHPHHLAQPSTSNHADTYLASQAASCNVPRQQQSFKRSHFQSTLADDQQQQQHLDQQHHDDLPTGHQLNAASLFKQQRQRRHSSSSPNSASNTSSSSSLAFSPTNLTSRRSNKMIKTKHEGYYPIPQHTNISSTPSSNSTLSKQQQQQQQLLIQQQQQAASLAQLYPNLIVKNPVFTQTSPPDNTAADLNKITGLEKYMSPGHQASGRNSPLKLVNRGPKLHSFIVDSEKEPTRAGIEDGRDRKHLVKSVEDLPVFITVENNRYASYEMSGEPYICLPQLLQYLREKFSLRRMIERFEDSMIQFTEASPKQIEGFIKSSVLPPSAKSCPLIKRSDTDKICLALHEQCYKGKKNNIVHICSSDVSPTTTNKTSSSLKNSSISPTTTNNNSLLLPPKHSNDHDDNNTNDDPSKQEKQEISFEESLREIIARKNKKQLVDDDNEGSLKRRLSEGASELLVSNPSSSSGIKVIDTSDSSIVLGEQDKSSSGCLERANISSSSSVVLNNEKLVVNCTDNHHHHEESNASKSPKSNMIAIGKKKPLFDSEAQSSILSLARAVTSTLIIRVYHRCFGKCVGLYYPSLLNRGKSICIECTSCHIMFSPRRFIGHTHGNQENNVTHWGFNSYNWNHYIKLSRKQTMNNLDDEELLNQFRTLQASAEYIEKSELSGSRDDSDYEFDKPDIWPTASPSSRLGEITNVAGTSATCNSSMQPKQSPTKAVYGVVNQQSQLQHQQQQLFLSHQQEELLKQHSHQLQQQQLSTTLGETEMKREIYICNNLASYLGNRGLNSNLIKDILENTLLIVRKSKTLY